MADLVRADVMVIETNGLAHTEKFGHPRRPDRMPCQNAAEARNFQLLDLGRAHRPTLELVYPVVPADLVKDGVDERHLVSRPIPVSNDPRNRLVDLLVQDHRRIGNRLLAIGELVGLVAPYIPTQQARGGRQDRQEDCALNRPINQTDRRRAQAPSSGHRRRPRRLPPRHRKTSRAARYSD